MQGIFDFPVPAYPLSQAPRTHRLAGDVVGGAIKRLTRAFALAAHTEVVFQPWPYRLHGLISRPDFEPTPRIMAMSRLVPTPGIRGRAGAHPGNCLMQPGLVALDGNEVAVALLSNRGQRFFWQ